MAADRSFELDLNGHKIGIYYGGLVIGADDKDTIDVNITNSSENNDGIITNTYAGGSALIIHNGTVQINGENYNRDESSIAVPKTGR